MNDELHQDEQANNPAVEIAVMKERLASMGRELRELKDAQRREMEEVRAGQKALAGKMDEVLGVMNAAQGGWRTLVLLGGASATMGGMIVSIVSHFKG